MIGDSVSYAGKKYFIIDHYNKLQAGSYIKGDSKYISDYFCDLGSAKDFNRSYWKDIELMLSGAVVEEISEDHLNSAKVLLTEKIVKTTIRII